MSLEYQVFHIIANIIIYIYTCRTVVIATRPKLQVKIQQFEEKYERKLTDILTKVLRSWKGEK